MTCGHWGRHSDEPASAGPPVPRPSTNTPTLLARSRHASVRSLERYARPGPEVVARHVAATDPAARRRPPASPVTSNAWLTALAGHRVPGNPVVGGRIWAVLSASVANRSP